ncbi:hypothetical protein AB4027_06925 [Alkalibacterium putridalgicola]|uniref:DUF6978 family protein n=1 Tax=Alkalibacterium putridalgicola TaxID=426703 RepID=UPI0034D00DF3
MNLDELHDNEVQGLISSLKNPSKIFGIQEINAKISPMLGSLEVNEKIVGIADEIEYILHIYRGNRDMNRYTINLRFASKHHQLIRIDIGSGHNNPDGTRIDGDHIHIYSREYPKRDRVAYPLDSHEFPNVQNIIDAFSNFTLYTSIKENLG